MRIISALNKSVSIKIFRSKKPNILKKPTNDQIPTITAIAHAVEAGGLGKQNEPASEGSNHGHQDLSNINNPMYRENEMKIQMLSRPMYEQIFKNSTKKDHDQKNIQRYTISDAICCKRVLHLYNVVFL